jgi:hypothetical protein
MVFELLGRQRHQPPLAFAAGSLVDLLAATVQNDVTTLAGKSSEYGRMPADWKGEKDLAGWQR